jgi:RNA-binding protein
MIRVKVGSFMSLTGKQRQHLRALAHHLEPVVQVGHEGVSVAVLAQIEEALVAHELIKVRVGTESPSSRDEAATEIAEGAGAEIAQTIGRIIVVWRRREANAATKQGKKAKIALSPRGGAAAGTKNQKGSKGRTPGQRMRAQAKTKATRAAKRRKLADRRPRVVS